VGLGKSVGCLALALVASAVSLQPQSPPTVDPLVQQRLSLLEGESRIIVTAPDATMLDALIVLIEQLGGTSIRRLPIITGCAVTVPNAALATLAAIPQVLHISLDRDIAGKMERTGAAVGAVAVRLGAGVDGSGVGVAVLDSGVTAWHDDLADAGGTSQRVAQFVDFTAGAEQPSDEYGHGTHVAGVIAGNGFDSAGARTGIAPGAHLVVLKVLDASGRGRISDVIAALDYVVAHKAEHNIRIANLSVAAGVYESFHLDPLTIAARRAVEAGIVVVAAAGNLGRQSDGSARYGSITAPGNSPWVLTVGASSHMGTIDRADDTIASFSSRGPTAIDRVAKPDVVAPGVGIESLNAQGSLLSTSMAAYALNGTVTASYPPYLSLSGTSMATPVVSGTVALMLEANPTLTPNAVKAILQYTAQKYTAYDVLTQGTGFLNAEGAVELARYFTSFPSAPYPSTAGWGRRLIWGSRLFSKPLLFVTTPAWVPSVRWGSPAIPSSALILWPLGSFNLLTGVWATDTGESVVWGTTDGESVVWGTGDEGESVVWGTGCEPECHPIVWGGQ
jgi:serine protease AprX